MPRMGLDKDAVIRAASVLADAEGLEALTLARLAQQLNVRTPSLYNHVSSLAALRRELQLAGLRETGRRLTRAAVGLAGRDAMVAVGMAYREFAGQHPGLYAASLRAAPADDTELVEAGNQIVGLVLAVLSAYGLKGDDALHATRGLRAIIHGFVSLEAAGAFGLALDLEESLRRLIVAFSDGLSAKQPA